VSHTTHQEFCLHTQRANISLPVPLHITPTFSADIGKLSISGGVFITNLLLTQPRNCIQYNSQLSLLGWLGSIYTCGCIFAITAHPLLQNYHSTLFPTCIFENCYTSSHHIAVAYIIIHLMIVETLSKCCDLMFVLVVIT